MAKEHKELFRKVVNILGLNRHEVMPEWEDDILVKIRKIQLLQRGLFSKVDGEIDGLEKIPIGQRKV